MKFKYIAIEREYGSGGSETGKKLSELLKIPCYGKEILEMTAKKKNVSIEYVEELEENSNGSFLYYLYKMADVSGKPTAAESVNIEEINIIRELAASGPAIFVGRAAAFALKDKSGLLKVFIHADSECREKRAIEAYGIDKASVKNVIKSYDKRRSSYYKANFGNDWKDHKNYSMVLDSSILGIDKCAAAIAECVK